MRVWNKKLILSSIVFVVGISIITSGVIGAIKSQEKEIKEKEEALKDRGFEILKHETNYLDLSRRFDKTRSDYENLGENFLNYRSEKERLEQENQRLKIQVSRGRARSLMRNAQPRRSAAPANSYKSVSDCESGGSMSARNGPYVGKWQFHPGTFNSFKSQAGVPNGSILSESDQDQVAIWMLSHGYRSHWPECGR